MQKKWKRIIAISAFLLLKVRSDYKKICEREKHIDIMRKQEKVLEIYEEWMELDATGKKISDFFLKERFKTIGIYGMGRLGKNLYFYLNAVGVKVECIVDNKYSKENKEFYHTPCYSVDGEIPSVDLYIVTVPSEVMQIKKQLFEKTDSAVQSLQEIMFMCR